MPTHFPTPRAGTLAAALSIATLLFMSGCDDKTQSAGQAANAGPPPSVVAVAAESRSVEDESEFVGRVVAVDRVELRARVQGFLKERSFTEGQQVEVGEVLFLIEPDQYQAIVDQRKADLTKAKADAQNADAQLKRGQELAKTKNISQSQVDELQAAASIAEAGIAQAQAALGAAELDLSYTQVKSPVAGRVGLAQYTVGNLVGPDSGSLATIVSRDPIYVQFPLTQRELLDAKREIQSKGGDPNHVIVQVRLPDGSLYDQTGHINFVDVTTDQGTDSVTLRADISNPNGILVDGQYVGVVLQAGTPEEAIVISQSALQIDQQGVFVLIVDADNKAQVRRIAVGAVQGPDIVVTSGLKAGDLVIIQGIQKVRPGMEVIATPPVAPDAPEATTADQGADAS